MIVSPTHRETRKYHRGNRLSRTLTADVKSSSRLGKFVVPVRDKYFDNDYLSSRYATCAAAGHVFPTFLAEVRIQAAFAAVSTLAGQSFEETTFCCYGPQDCPAIGDPRLAGG
jgi:hypothetical protein